MPRETDVLRLDYSKAPQGPRYDVERTTWSFCNEPGKTTLASMWAHYKREHNPPGMEVIHDHEYEESTQRWFTSVGFGGRGPGPDGHPTQAEARAAAWTWYDRRHALSLREEALGLGARMVPFSEYLALTDVAVDVSNQCCEPLELDGGRPLEVSDVGAALLLLVHRSAG